MGKTIQSILADLKPEAAYFLDWDGKRTGFIVFDMQDTSQIPAVAEPWFLALDRTPAWRYSFPVMTPADLAKAGPGIEAAVKKYT